MAEKDTVNSFDEIELLRGSLRADCGNCCGLCCTALYFSASDGFPNDKEAGVPCMNLLTDYRCRVHDSLGRMGLKGCTAYDCFGAGQKTAQVTYGGKDWRQNPESAGQIFEAFLIIRQLHEMLWYLAEACEITADSGLCDKIKAMLDETGRLTYLGADFLLNFDLAAHRSAVNMLLLEASELVRNAAYNQRKSQAKHKGIRRMDYIGANLKGKDLRGENFNGAYLIAADLRKTDLSGAVLIGADLRDSDLRGADLSNSIFLTQAQINTARGDSETKLPKALTRPEHW